MSWHLNYWRRERFFGAMGEMVSLKIQNDLYLLELHNADLLGGTIRQTSLYLPTYLPTIPRVIENTTTSCPVRSSNNITYLPRYLAACTHLLLPSHKRQSRVRSVLCLLLRHERRRRIRQRKEFLHQIVWTKQDLYLKI